MGWWVQYWFLRQSVYWDIWDGEGERGVLESTARCGYRSCMDASLTGLFRVLIVWFFTFGLAGLMHPDDMHTTNSLTRAVYVIGFVGSAVLLFCYEPAINEGFRALPEVVTFSILL